MKLVNGMRKLAVCPLLYSKETRGFGLFIQQCCSFILDYTKSCVPKTVHRELIVPPKSCIFICTPKNDTLSSWCHVAIAHTFGNRMFCFSQRTADVCTRRRHTAHPCKPVCLNSVHLHAWKCTHAHTHMHAQDLWSLLIN